MDYDNPASRLRHVLEMGLAFPRDHKTMAAWSKLLDTEDLDLLLHRLAIVQMLPGQIAELVEVHYPAQAARSAHWRDAIRTAFLQQHLGGKWETFAAHIPAHIPAMLGNIEELLHNKLQVKITSDEDLQKIIDMFKGLANAVDESSEIPGRLKVYLKPAIAELLRAVRDYKYDGALPIRRSGEAMLGHAVADKEYKNFLVDHELGKRLLENVQAMESILSITSNVHQLGQATTAFIANLPQ